MAAIAERTNGKRPAKAVFKAPPEALRAPTIPDPEARRARHKAAAATKREAAEQERYYNGVLILREEPVPSPLPNGGPFRYSRLFLQDGDVAWACRDCDYQADTRGEVMAHRNADHGSRYGKKKPKSDSEEDPNLLDLVLPERENGIQPGESLREWTIGELQAVAPTITALGNLIEKTERENEELREQLKQIQISKSDQHKINVYDANLKEIAELRAWKRNVVRKFAGVGFKLEENQEEEQ